MDTIYVAWWRNVVGYFFSFVIIFPLLVCCTSLLAVICYGLSFELLKCFWPTNQLKGRRSLLTTNPSNEILKLQNLLFGIVFQESMQLRQPVCGHFLENTCEPILPFIAVTKKGEFQWRTVKKYKIDVNYCFFLLYIVCDFSVPVKTITKLSLTKSKLKEAGGSQQFYPIRENWSHCRLPQESFNSLKPSHAGKIHDKPPLMFDISYTHGNFSSFSFWGIFKLSTWLRLWTARLQIPTNAPCDIEVRWNCLCLTLHITEFDLPEQLLCVQS